MKTGFLSTGYRICGLIARFVLALILRLQAGLNAEH
jgi:hypothetical protein